MRRLIAGLALLPSVFAMVVLTDASPAAACSCVGFTDQQAYERADAVFVGRVVGYEPPAPGGTSSSTDPATWIFSVERVYKDGVTAMQEVVSEVDSASCGLSIPKTGEFLVFAAHEGSPGLSPTATEGQYYAGLCGGTRAISGGPVPPGLGNGSRPSDGVASPSAPGRDVVLGPEGEEIPGSSDSPTSVWIMLGPVLGVMLVAIVVAVLARRRRSRAS